MASGIGVSMSPRKVASIYNKTIGRILSVSRNVLLGKPQRKQEEKKEEPKYIYSIDSPRRTINPNKTVTIRGWITPLGDINIVSMRARNNKVYHEIQYGQERADVAKVKSEYGHERTRYSGFLAEFEFEDGELEIEMDLGEGFRSLYKTKIKYSPEKMFESYYNSGLATNMAEHQTMLDNKQQYYYEKAQQKNYKHNPKDPRLIAFYLPQYHPIKENDITWGKGFTDWVNVVAGRPRFVGHQQPNMPADLGYYDLRLEENIKNQIDLAKKHGIHGFCFYYYWFSGKKLLDTPIDTFLRHKEWDFNFMICWANENWTKRWDGREKDVIIAQKYLKSDPLSFIKDVEHILTDPRYINNKGKPVLAVYRGSELKDPELYIDTWRKYMADKHGLELEIVSMLNFDTSDPRTHGFDAGIEFAPLTDFRRDNFDRRFSEAKIIGGSLLDIDFSAKVADYRDFVSKQNHLSDFGFPTYKSVAPSWDNEARKKGRGSLTFFGSNPDLYGKWLNLVLKEEAGKQDGSIVFINAWNEWAEGAMLEPSQHAGHAVLNRTTEVLSQYSENPDNTINFPIYGIDKTRRAKLAVIVHVYYEEEWQYIYESLGKLEGIPYDLFVTISTVGKDIVPDIKKMVPGVHITEVPNRGRDMLPFIFIVNRISDLGYEIVLKLHTKRSQHRTDGKKWFMELVDSLLPSRGQVAKIVESLESGVPMIGPAGHYISLNSFMGGNKEKVTRLFHRTQTTPREGWSINDESNGFFAGSMFWCRMDSLRPLLVANLIPEDFDSEKGQIDGTLAHALERAVALPLLAEGKSLYKSSKKRIAEVKDDEVKNRYRYADEINLRSQETQNKGTI